MAINKKAVFLSIISFSLLLGQSSQILGINVQWQLDPILKTCWQDLLNQDLESLGLYSVTTNPDLIISNHATPAILAGKIPLIILERKDAASLKYENLVALKNPLVKAIFKNQTLADPLLNNKPLGFNDSYHFGLLREYLPTIPLKYPPQLTHKELNKIRCVIWNIPESAWGHKNCPLKEYELDLLTPRPLDVFFAGTVMPLAFNENNVPLNPEEPNLYQWHREQAVNAVHKLTNIQSFILTKGQALTYAEYIATVKQAKIVISPWGFGEFCYRDFEAMQCGAILVKPDTSFIHYIPAIYQNNYTYVPCKADFSDLHEIVHIILNNYEEYTDMRKRAKELMQSCCSLDTVAQNFVNAVKNALNS